MILVILKNYMSCMSSQSNCIGSENLQLRLENYRLKKKIKKFECLLYPKNWVVKKVFNKYYYKFFFLKFIVLARKWNKMYKKIFFNEFNLLFNLNQKSLSSDINLLKKKLSQVTMILSRYIDLLKFFSTLLTKFSELFIFSQTRFIYIKIFFDQMLTLKLHKLFNSQNCKKVLFFKNFFFKFQADKINDIKSRLEQILNTSLFTNPKKFIKFIIIDKINKKKKTSQPQKLFFHLGIIKYKLSIWITIFLSKFSTQKEFLIELFKKLVNLNLLTKNLLENCFVYVQKNSLKTGIIFKKISQFFCKIRILKKKLKKIKKTKLNHEKINKKQIKCNKKFKTLQDSLNFFNFNKQLIFFRPKNQFKVIKQMVFFEKYIKYLNINKKKKFKIILNKDEFFNKLLKNMVFKVKIYQSDKFFIEYNHFLFNNLTFLQMKISFYRILDIDKEINTLWCILKIFNNSIILQSNLTGSFVKFNYFKLQDQYFKMKNEFNKIVFNLKQKIFIFQKNNSIVKKILLKKKKKKNEIENKLYEIKGMEADFSEILRKLKNKCFFLYT
nr:hypothetical protein Cry52Nrm3_p122 [Cryptomonas curvata]